MKTLKDIIREGAADGPEEFGVVEEGGLGRVWQESGGDFAVLTAFRMKYDLKENRARNLNLLKALNWLGLGPHLLTGHWVEVKDTHEVGAGDKEPVVRDKATGAVVPYADAQKQGIATPTIEESFFVPRPKDWDKVVFEKHILEVIREYEQDSAVLAIDGVISLLYQNGSKHVIGSGTGWGKVAQAYSQLRRRPDVPFVFEGTKEPGSNSAKAVFHVLGIRWFSRDGGFVTG
jgi:hypothetical protein